MTDKEELDAIRAKLERRISVFSKCSPETFIPIRIDEYRKLLYMVEKHLKDTTSDDLEGEINRYLSTLSTSKDNGIVFCEKMARHFAAWQKQQMMKDSVLCGVDGWFINNKRNCRKNGRFYKYYESTITHDKPLPMENGKDYRLITIKED